MNAHTHRVTEIDDKPWFAVADLHHRLRDGDVGEGKVRSGVATWLKSNLPAGSISVHPVRGKDGRLRRTLCVSLRQVHVVGMYAAFLGSGKNFRAKWADLPNTPELDLAARHEIAWLLLGKDSDSGICKRSQLSRDQVWRILQVAAKYQHLFPNEQPTYWEAVAAIKGAEPGWKTTARYTAYPPPKAVADAYVS